MRSFLLAAALAFAPAPALAQTFPDNAALTQMLKDRVDDGRGTGFVLGVMEADGTTRIVAYGDAGPGAKPLGPDSVFEIGSITKVFTSTLLADMAQKNEVKLDVPAQTYAPAGMTLPKRNGKEITLLNLAEQNSGLPRMPDNFHPADAANPYADYTAAQLNAFLGAYQLPRDIGEKFEYSNLGVGTLGAILANKAGKPYEALVQERVLKPLGMSMTGITLSPAMQATLAKGHGPTGDVTANWDLPTLAGAGALRSNMTDMLKFLAANIGEPKTSLQRAMRDARAPRTEAGPAMRIGLNWLTIERNGVTIAWHNGGTGGYASFIGIDQAHKRGVVLLSNRSGSFDDIGIHLLDPASPLTTAPPAPKQHKAITVPPETLAQYTGVYAMDSAPAFKFTVTLENGYLFVQATGQQKLPVYAEGPADFFYKVVDAQLTFTPAKDGQPAFLILHQNGANQKATRQP